MKRFCCTWLMVMGLGHTAAAQAPGEPQGAPTAPTAPFLEKRIPEELASEGVVLSRSNLGLTLEQLGAQWLVSLVDLTTGRVAASTKVDVLPADREAAVAAMTHVVAELATQIVGRPERAPAPPPAPAAPPAEAPAEDRARELAELRFRRESIRFGTAFLIGGGTVQAVSSGRGWKAFQGDLDQLLEPEKFYTAVGRPDLIEGYRQRRFRMKLGYTIGAIGVGASLVVFFAGRDPNSDSFATTYSLGTAFFLIGGGALALGIHYHNRPHPIEANEAKALADKYNQALRSRLGLPVVARRPVLRDLQIAPYTTGSNGGLVLAGRF